MARPAIHELPLARAARDKFDAIRADLISRFTHDGGQSASMWSKVDGPDMPTLSGLPLLGNLVEFMTDRIALHERAAAAGPFVRMNLARLPIYVVTDSSIAHEVLSEKAEFFLKGFEVRRYMHPLLGEGLLTAEGTMHRNHRKLLAPAFAPKRIANYGTTMVSETATQLDKWQDGARIDVADHMMELALAIAGRTLFSADIRNEAEQVERGLTLAMRSLMAIMTSPLQLPYGVPLPRHNQMRKAIAMLDEVVYRLIAEGRRNGTDRGDVMSTLLMARDETDGTGLSDQQVRDEVMTLLLAGHETTANTLAWTMYELGRHPEIAARIEAEVDEVLGGRAVTVEDLPQLPYTLQVIDESMRLHPAVYVTSRAVAAPVEIAGKQFAAGGHFLINIRGIHHRPDYFPEPLVFNPDRMTVAAKKARPRGQFMPFGAGPRVCIGAHFALIEAHLALATMAQHVRLEAVSEAVVVPEPLVTLRPRGGLPMTVRRRRIAS